MTPLHWEIVATVVGASAAFAVALDQVKLRVDTLVVTGTLTEGRPRVVHVEPPQGFAADQVLQQLASVERASEHPLALAIVNDALERRLTLAPVIDFDSPVGKGVVGNVGGQRVVSGSAKFLAEHDIDVSALNASAEAQRAKVAMVIFVGLDGLLAGFVAIADPIKATTPRALQALKSAGVRIAMLTAPTASRWMFWKNTSMYLAAAGARLFTRRLSSARSQCRCKWCASGTCAWLWSCGSWRCQ